MKMGMIIVFLLALLIMGNLAFAAGNNSEGKVVLASKPFTESYGNNLTVPGTQLLSSGMLIPGVIGGGYAEKYL